MRVRAVPSIALRAGVACLAASSLAAQEIAPPPDFPTSPPATGPVPSLRIPAPGTRTLDNGLTVQYVARPDLPVVHATLVTRGGGADAPADAVELSSFTADLLDEGANGRGALELSSAVELLGASLRVESDWDAVTVDLEVLQPRLAEALALMADVVIRPDFPEEEVERKREERLTDLARGRDEPRVIAANALAALVYGDHPYGRLPTTEATAAITRDQMVGFHATFFRPNVSTLILVGDVHPDRDQTAVETAFGGWERGPVPVPADVAAPVLGPTTIYIVDRPGAPQSEIRIGHPGVARSTPDYFALTVMNTILGGSFTSRLNSNLREEHGYSYGAGSGYSMRRGPGPFQAGAAVVADKTDSAVVEFFKELRRIRSDPVPEDELERARNYLALGFPRRFETTRGTAGQLADLTIYGLDTTWLQEYVPATLSVGSAAVQAAAETHVRPDRAVVVIVGDRATIEPALRALRLAPVRVRGVEEFVR